MLSVNFNLKSGIVFMWPVMFTLCFNYFCLTDFTLTNDKGREGERDACERYVNYNRTNFYSLIWVVV